MTESLSIRLGPKLAEALRQEAKQTGMTKGEIARQAIEARLKANGKLVVMQSFFGIMEGPPDLSTNKRYRRQWKKPRA